MGKRNLLAALTGSAVGLFLFGVILHIIGFFTYWDSRWHLWLYVPILALYIALIVWKIVFRLPRRSFRDNCPKLLLLLLILILCYLLVMFFLNVFVSQDGVGYLDDEGFAFRDRYLEFPITGEEYHTLHRAAFQMTTEPLTTVAAFPALFFFVRYKTERANENGR